MKTKTCENLSDGELIMADLYSRPNAINGKYRVAKIGLNDLSVINKKDVFYLQTLKMKADLADIVIDEAESQGKNTNNPEIMKELGEEINSAGTPIYRSEAVMIAIFSSLQLIFYYGVAVSIWGLVFKGNLLSFGLWGIIFGVIISVLSVGPVIAFQRTREKVKDISFGAGVIWGNIAIIIGVLGIFVWIIGLVF